MASKENVQIGKLPPKYNFIVNPYPDRRLSKCPSCESKTGQRKVPLLIHVDPRQLITLNSTCRYCRNCDLLIAHKHEIEYHLYHVCSRLDPDIIGNDYLIFGTIEKNAWREGTKKPLLIGETLDHASDFKTIYEELRLQQEGWYPEGLERPIEEPPPSEEWVKED